MSLGEFSPDIIGMNQKFALVAPAVGFPSRTNGLAEMAQSITTVLSSSTLASGIYVWRTTHDKKAATGERAL